MVDEGFTASSAAFEVGYESVSQFTREYRRLFQAPPGRTPCAGATAKRWAKAEPQNARR
jgi:AraC-like DNA-binding protein